LQFSGIYRFFRLLMVGAFMFVFGTGTGFADQGVSFKKFIEDFESKAVASGVSRAIYRQVMGEIEHNPEIWERIVAQPEFSTPIWQYIETRVSSDRIEHGFAAIEKNRQLLNAIGESYGVDPFLLAAIWGIETNYGEVLENRGIVKPIIPSLASLVYAQRGRVLLDEKELIAALKLVQNGTPASSLIGSWAGAMGHLQVLPSVVLANGVDGDGDGLVDVNKSLADALATSATLLKSFGYQSGVDWGYEVILPADFDYTLASRQQMRRIDFFVDLGVKRVAGRKFMDLDQQVFLYVPTGNKGPKFLMTKNYLVLKSYNASDSYALSVAHLSDRLKGGQNFISDWPRQTKFPNREQRLQIQQRLADLGFYSGRIDGFIGPITQAAYQKFQLSLSMVADGFVTLEALQLLGP